MYRKAAVIKVCCYGARGEGYGVCKNNSCEFIFQRGTDLYNNRLVSFVCYNELQHCKACFDNLLDKKHRIGNKKRKLFPEPKLSPEGVAERFF